MGKEGGFVFAAAEGDGGEIRGVGFDQETVGGNPGGDLTKGVGIGEGDDAAEAEIEAEIEEGLGEGGGAGETVEDADAVGGSGPEPGMFAEEIKGIGIGFAAMDDDGAPDLAGEVQLGGEELALSGGGVGFVMIIEPDFADGTDERGVGRLEGFPQAGGVIAGGGTMATEADGGAKVGGETAGEIEDKLIFIRCATDGEEAINTGGQGARDPVGSRVGFGMEMGIEAGDHGLKSAAA